DWERHAVRSDQLAGGVLVVDRQGNDLDVQAVELRGVALERAQLSVAVRAPRAAVEQDHREVPGQRVWEVDRLAVDRGDRDGWEVVSGLEQCHRIALLRDVGWFQGCREAE